MTSIERAARALCKLDGHPENIKFEGKPMWQSYVDQVRAVLAAIREPSAAMAEAGVVGIDEVGGDCATQKVAAAGWKVMIDAALAEGE